jgi:hypothetical protein
MANKIQIRRGLKKNLPQLSPGEMGLASDTGEVFIGNGNGSENLAVNTPIDDTLSDTSEHPIQNKAVADALRDKQNEWVVKTSGSGNAYTAVLDPAPASLYTGMVITIIPHNVSTSTSATLNVNGLGAKQFRQRGYTTGTLYTPNTASFLTATKPVRLIYDGTYWVILDYSKTQWSDVQSKPSSFTPASHATTATTYGVGTASNYGHVKLSDSTSNTSSAASGIAATPYAVSQVWNRVSEVDNKIPELVYRTPSYWDDLARSDMAVNGGPYIFGIGNYSFAWITDPVYDYTDENGEEHYMGTGGMKKSAVFTGVGKDFTTVRISQINRSSTGYESNIELTFKDMTVILEGASNNVSLTFENCKIIDGENYQSTMLHTNNGDISIRDSEILLDVSQYIDSAWPNETACRSGFEVRNGRICIDNCSITLTGMGNSSFEGSWISGYELNLIYDAVQGIISNSTITCTCPNTKTKVNISNTGNINMHNNYIYLKDTRCSIYHYRSDTTPYGNLTGNYIEYISTYMGAATVTGNTFNHTSSGYITLLSTTNITGNVFKGSATPIACNSQKVIIAENLADNGITVSSFATGSYYSNNITY